jgi:hypothetical protein
MTTFSFILSNVNNFPVPPIGLEEPDDFTSIYGNSDFSFDVTFSGEDDESNPITISDVSLTDVTIPVEFEKLSGNSIRLSYSESPFQSEIFRFVKFINIVTGEIEDLNPEEVASEYSIIRWIPPSTRIINVTYTFAITYSSILFFNVTETFTVNQEFYWNFVPSLNNLDRLVEDSLY